MKNEAITICVGELALQFLEITLPQNVRFFDNYIVIISSKDIMVKDFCDKYPVQTLITNKFYENGAIFNKGAVYNLAFQQLKYKDEICILDCDVYIPDKLGNILLKKEFDKEYMYASRRVIAPKFMDFNLLCNFRNEYEKKLWICDGIGYGYMQMFNYNAKCFGGNSPIYPHSYEKYAANGDWQFRNKYFGDLSSDAKQYFGNLSEIPERCWHLGQPNMEGGMNFFIS